MAATVADLELAAGRFQALSDPIRLRILGLLADGERCVCDLMSELDAAQSRLSFHLRVLKDAGLVASRREGQWIYYTLQRDVLAEAVEVLTMSPSAWKRAARCCG